MGRSVDGQKEYQYARKPENDLASRLEAIQLRHVNIEDDQRGLERRTLVDGLLPIAGLAANFPTRFAFEHGTNHAPDVLVMINDENANQRASRSDPHF